MLILILILALVRFNPEGAPINTPSIPQCRCDAVSIYLRDNPSHFGTRARNDIIVSCLTTILACTWTTIHPNVPAPGESGWNLLKQRLVTWIYALLAPEAITAWAMRQYFGARWIKNDYNRYLEDKIKNSLKKRTLMEKIRNYAHEWMHGVPVPEGLEERKMRPWTITHGFFIQMGGFMRCEKGKPVSCYRYYCDLGRDIYEKRIDTPTITKTEILDRSKGDVLSKTIVILQTTWFIAQCIVRWSAHLPVTELEVVTLGFAMLNALTYGFWWHKPQSVGVPVFLETRVPAGNEGKPAEGGRRGEAGGQSVQSMVPVDADASVQSGEAREASGREGACAAEGAVEHSTAVIVEADAGEIVREGTNVHWRSMWKGVKGFWRNIRGTRTKEVSRKQVPMKQRSFFIRQLAEDREKHLRWQLVWRMPYVLVLAMLRPLAKLLEFTYTDDHKWDLHVPMFNTAGVQDETVFVVSSIIASLFGLVHFIPAWVLDFPSHPESLLWRISAAIITGQPIILGVWSKWTKGALWLPEYRSNPFGIAVMSTVPLYILARLMLLILAFLSLRRLSYEQLITIEWISFVPHL